MTTPTMHNMYGETNVGQPEDDVVSPNDRTFDNYMMNPGNQIGGVGRNIPRNLVDTSIREGEYMRAESSL